MKEFTTADLRKDSSVLNGNLILKKMKQGRDKIVDKQFVVIEVPVGCEFTSVAYAEAYIKAIMKELENKAG